MANDKTTNGTTTTPNAGTCCGATDFKAGFNTIADTFSETIQSAQNLNQKMVEAWTKNFAFDANPFNVFARRAVSFQNGVTEMTTRWMTESTKVAVDQINATTQTWQRSVEAVTGVATKGRKVEAITEVTRDIVTDAVNATSRNTERMVRLGLDQAQGMTGLVDETVTAVATSGKRN